MSSEIVVAILAVLGTVLGSLFGVLASARLTTYRIEKLEEKVDKHNTVIERVTLLETDNKSQWKRIDDMWDDLKGLLEAVVKKDRGETEIHG